MQSWVEYPLVDSRFRTWGAGDTYSIYPGARSSIRFERLVEGLQDAEKIRLLREEFTHDGNTASLQKLEDALAMFYTPRRTATWNDELNRAKQTLDELSR